MAWYFNPTSLQVFEAEGIYGAIAKSKGCVELTPDEAVEMERVQIEYRAYPIPADAPRIITISAPEVPPTPSHVSNLLQ